MIRITIAMSLILVGCIAMQPAASLRIGTISLPDGPTWVLGKNGLGKPFSVRIVLGNYSHQTLRIWGPGQPESQDETWVTLTDSGGHVTKLEWTKIARFSGSSFRELKPNETAVYTQELLRAKGIESLQPGSYNLVAHYASRTSSDGVTSDVWTGEIDSEPMTMHVIQP